ncbi:MAG: hypothetical protein Alpg2KO_19040 [Alphaproteobacteria bacterium]
MFRKRSRQNAPHRPTAAHRSRHFLGRMKGDAKDRHVAGKRDAKQRPFARFMLTIGALGTLTGCTATTKGKVTKLPQHPVRTISEPIKVPPPLPEKRKFTQEERNQWHFKGREAAWSAPSQESIRLDQLEQEFQQLLPGRAIVVMDSDLIHTSQSIANTATMERGALRGTMMQFVSARSGVLIKHGVADVWNKNLANRNISASRTDVKRGGLHHRSKSDEVCGIVPADPDTTALRDAARVAGLSGKALKLLKGRGKLDKDEMKRFFEVHEFGHCADDTFLPNAKGGMFQDPLSRHWMESLADTYAALKMAQEGDLDIGRKIQVVRLLNTYVNGTGKLRSCKLANRNWVVGAAVYHTHDSLNTAMNWVERGGGKHALKVMSDAEIREKAIEIVQAVSMDADQLTTLTDYLHRGGDYIADLDKAIARGDKKAAARKTFLQEFAAKGEAMVKDHMDVAQLFAPRDMDATGLEDKLLPLMTEIAARAAKRGGTPEALAAEYARARNILRAEVEAGGPDADLKTVMLRTLSGRLFNGEKLYHDLIHGDYKPGDTAKSLVKPGAKAPVARPKTPTCKGWGDVKDLAGRPHKGQPEPNRPAI